jgi:hypothetical protein
LTGAEALTIGHHLIACAAIGLDRTGIKVVALLPPLPTTPPRAATASAPATNTAQPVTKPTTAAAPAPATGTGAGTGTGTGTGNSPPPSTLTSKPHPHRAAPTPGDHRER